MAGPFQQGACEQVFGDLLDLIRGCDFAVANLECPLVGSELRPVPKSGPNLMASVNSAKTLRQSGFKAVGLANNHIMDFGKEGLASTLAACASAGLGTFGAGPSLTESGRPLVVPLGGIRIAFLAVAEDERCLASPFGPGANPADPIWLVRTLKEARGTFDRLVVLFHGGNEGFQYPAPWLRESCRFLVEQGADAVICQHSHCVGSMEVHQGGLILYGQGNFIFDYPGHGSLGNQGLGLVLTFREEQPVDVSFHPLKQLPGDEGVRLSPQPEAQALMELLRLQSEVLADPERYALVWSSYCDQRREGFLTRLFGLGSWLQQLNRRGWLFHRLSQADLLRIQNLVSCESHRNALRTSLDNLIDTRSLAGRNQG
jgi:poly-gamma-glutamate synthesis protein (capsule biosynthesis protein)